MKKIAIISITILNLCYAQKGFEISFVSGFGFSNIWNAKFPPYSTTYTPSYNIGLSAQYNFDKTNTIRLDVVYYKKGYMVHYNYNQVNYYYDKPFDYLCISPMAQFHLGKKANKITRFYFQIGPYFGFSLKENYATKVFDVGINAGAGVKFNIFKSKLFVFVEAKDQLGLLNVSRNNIYISNHCFTGAVGISYLFESKRPRK